MAGEIRVEVPAAQAATARIRAAADQYNEAWTMHGPLIAAALQVAMTPTGTSGTPSPDIQRQVNEVAPQIAEAVPKLGENGMAFADGGDEIIRANQENDAAGARGFRQVASAVEGSGVTAVPDAASTPRPSTGESGPRGPRI